MLICLYHSQVFELHHIIRRPSFLWQQSWATLTLSFCTVQYFGHMKLKSSFYGLVVEQGDEGTGFQHMNDAGHGDDALTATNYTTGKLFIAAVLVCTHVLLQLCHVILCFLTIDCSECSCWGYGIWRNSSWLLCFGVVWPKWWPAGTTNSMKNVHFLMSQSYRMWYNLIWYIDNQHFAVSWCLHSFYHEVGSIMFFQKSGTCVRN